MATLETIRTRAGVFISVVIGIALLSFIINPDSLQRTSMMFSSKYDAGEIAGKSVSYQDYMERVEQQIAMYKMTRGDAGMSEQVTEQIREQTWNEIIKERVIDTELEKIGVTVSDDELTDLVSGDNPAPMISQIFRNQETGEFDRSRLIQTIKNLDSDPNLKMQWLSVESQLKDEQLINKYANLMAKSTIFNTLDVKNDIAKTASNVTFSYVVKPYSVVDTASQASVSDLKKYYNENKDLYEQTRSRDIKYIRIPVSPSADDYRLTMENMTKIEPEFITTPVADLGAFVNRNSEKVFDELYYKKGALPLVVDTFAFSENTGAFLPIYQNGETYNMSRISGIKNLPDSVRARHILLSPENAHKADSIITELKGGASFVALANEFSIDQAANMKGGDLSWFTFPAMVRPFSDSCFYNPKGKIMKVRTQFGEHIVEILDKGVETKHVQIATVQLLIVAGKTTSQELFNKANSIAVESNNSVAKLEELAAERNLSVLNGFRIGLSDKRVADFTNAREITRWAYDAKVGDVSEVFEIDNNSFVVAVLTTIREDGTAPFEQVKSEVEVAVKKEKQAIAMAEELKTAMQSASTIDDLATKTNLQVANTNTRINFAASYIPGITFPEKKLIGAANGAAQNTLTGPIKGENGVYVFVVTDKAVQENTIDISLQREHLRRSINTYEFYDVLINKAKVVDNRGKFY